MAENPPPNAGPLRFDMSADRTRVTVTPMAAGSFDLTAAQVDALVRALIAGRAAMRPAREANTTEELNQVLTSSGGMHTRVQPEEDGSGDVLFGLFHPGLGWVGTHFNKVEVERIAEAINVTRVKNLRR